jgi:hypothetical protein
MKPIIKFFRWWFLGGPHKKALGGTCVSWAPGQYYLNGFDVGVQCELDNGHSGKHCSRTLRDNSSLFVEW